MDQRRVPNHQSLSVSFWEERHHRARVLSKARRSQWELAARDALYIAHRGTTQPYSAWGKYSSATKTLPSAPLYPLDGARRFNQWEVVGTTALSGTSLLTSAHGSTGFVDFLSEIGNDTAHYGVAYENPLPKANSQFMVGGDKAFANTLLWLGHLEADALHYGPMEGMRAVERALFGSSLSDALPHFSYANSEQAWGGALFDVDSGILPLPLAGGTVSDLRIAGRGWNGVRFWKLGAEGSILPVRAKALGSYDSYNLGPLSKRSTTSFLGAKYNSYLLKEDLVVYRAGAKGTPLGEYFSLDKPASEVQLRIDKAVCPTWPGGGKSVVDTGYEVKIPKGTMIHVGDVAPQGNIFLGRTQQIFIEKPWLNPNVQVLDTFPLQEELIWNLQAK